ncbi:MAG: OB-fold nucleic acid binding domain-containing protein [Sporichthyaceae bacterium]
MGQHPGVLKRAVNRLASSAKEHEAAELQKGCVEMGAVPVKELPDREKVRVAGTLRTVTLRPRAGVPALVAELYDGSGSINLVWLGRRQIAGIEPGRALVATGRVTRDNEQPVIFNPRYELRPAGAE